MTLISCTAVCQFYYTVGSWVVDCKKQRIVHTGVSKTGSLINFSSGEAPF